MKRYILDTSVVIDFLRRRDKENTLLYKVSENELLVSIVTHTELFSGKSIWEDNEARKTVEDLLSEVDIIPLTSEISAKAGYIKAYSGLTSIIDAIIAATAIIENTPLVTLNQKHFVDIPEIQLYHS